MNHLHHILDISVSLDLIRRVVELPVCSAILYAVNSISLRIWTFYFISSLPSSFNKGILDDLGELLSRILTDFEYVLITGEFNIRMDVISDPLTVHFLVILNVFGLT